MQNTLPYYKKKRKYHDIHRVKLATPGKRPKMASNWPKDALLGKGFLIVLLEGFAFLDPQNVLFVVM